VSVFVCDECGCIDNTALTNYWSRNMKRPGGRGGKALCSECDPDIGRWHGRFDRRPYDPEVDAPINRPLSTQQYEAITESFNNEETS
jgi:hypothetical protein